MRVLVLDTGPLCECSKAIDAAGRDGPMPTGAFFKSRSELDSFRRFLGQHHKRLTVHGVAVELWGLFRSERRAADLWAHYVALMRELNIEERAFNTTDLDDDDAGSDGPVDVALCALARKERFGHADVTILTMEQRHVAKWRDRSKSKVVTLQQVLDQIRRER